ncbi:MAG: molybdopterin-dependent oxidoreductase [Ornithinimicrobium sp.]|uniref:molybdopterin-dependent oxidoreductase n=1 Tax=Ornithinimicrobium sp. TaxID=1977084 RepID=UPI0026E001FD|nr:molybdopterin-dependent oxidoreductase [Ornithinimicrobium sp.]MDO5738898.1 molybdopterin-dependent oxidoreductase [Ornithinimicrobium sp.]
MRTRDGAAVGVAAGAVTLGVAELMAALWTGWLGSAGSPSPLLAIGGAFVDRTPAWLKDWAVSTFGTADKMALAVGMILVIATVVAVIGVLNRRRTGLAQALFALVGVIGMAAVLSRPGSSAPDVLPTVAATLVGLWLLRALPRWLADRGDPQRSDVESLDAGLDGRFDDADRASRRDVIRVAGGLTVLGILGVVAGRAMSAGSATAEKVARAFRLPTPRTPVSVPAGASLDVPGVTSYLTPNDGFYRIDSALQVPRIDPAEWSLRVYGLVDKEIELSFEELLAEEHLEKLVTLTCVSNEVGGNLAGNARWIGWPIRELLARAGVQPEADMVLSRSIDGWTAGTPIEALTDDRDALLAVGMNGEALPREHGFPVRMVVPGLYGYVSATKWVTELKVTRFDADEGYWTPRGWDALGPIKTASRIDVPRNAETVAAGDVVVAGVAWAQHRGIDAVEVRVDGGDWQAAPLREEPNVDSWRLWSWTWPATEGEHELEVRATDGNGEVQTDQIAPPAPDGASGYQRIRIKVRAD